MAKFLNVMIDPQFQSDKTALPIGNHAQSGDQPDSAAKHDKLPEEFVPIDPVFSADEEEYFSFEI